MSARGRPCGRAHVQIHPAAQLKITQLSCPVSITNKTYTEEDWTGTAGHVVVWCASVLLLSLSSGCVISRVCMWAFSFLHVIHCVSVLSMPSECCVRVIVCGLILFLPSTVFICCTPYPTDLHLGKQKRTLQFRKVFPWKIPYFTVYKLYSIYVYVCTCTHAQVKLTNSSGINWTFNGTYFFYPRIHFRLRNVHTCLYICRIFIKSIGQLWELHTVVTLSAVLCDDFLYKAQGHWGQRSHLGQGIVPLETYHAENKQTF